MGWQDAPAVGQAGAKVGPAWMNAPVAGPVDKTFQPLEDYGHDVMEAVRGAGHAIMDRSRDLTARAKAPPPSMLEAISQMMDDLGSLPRMVGALANVPITAIGSAPVDALVSTPVGRLAAKAPIKPSIAPKLRVDASGISLDPAREMTADETSSSVRNAINTAMMGAQPASARIPLSVRRASLPEPGPLPVDAPVTEEEIAGRVLSSRAKADPVEMRKVADAMRASGIDPTALDVTGQKGLRLARAVGVTNDDAGEALVGHAERTASGTKPKVMARTRDLAIDQPGTAADLADALKTSRDAAATTTYAKPYDTLVDVPDAVKDMLGDSAGRSLIAKARSDAIWNQDWGRQVELDKLLRPTEDGQLPQISAGTLDRIRMAARDAGRGFAANNLNSRAKGAFSRQAQLDGILDGIPELKEARAGYHAKSQAIDLIEKPGAQLDPFSTDPADYAKWLDKLSPEARAANQVKLRQDILDTLGGQRSNTFGSIDQIATSDYARSNLSHAFGPDEAKGYLDNITARLKQTRNANFASPNAGSRTAVLENDTGKKLSNALDAVDTAVKMGKGDIIGLGTKVAAKLKTMGLNDTEAAALTAANTDPTKLDGVIAAIEKQRAARGARPVDAPRVRQLLIPASGAMRPALSKERE